MIFEKNCYILPIFAVEILFLLVCMDISFFSVMTQILHLQMMCWHFTTWTVWITHDSELRRMYCESGFKMQPPYHRFGWPIMRVYLTKSRTGSCVRFKLNVVMVFGRRNFSFILIHFFHCKFFICSKTQKSLITMIKFNLIFG